MISLAFLAGISSMCYCYDPAQFADSNYSYQEIQLINSLCIVFNKEIGN